jgi:type IV secretion system protein VirB4
MERDILYKALTRPALVFGLPLQLVVFIVWLTVMLCMFISYYFVGVGVFLFVICVILNKRDEMFFSILSKKIMSSSGSVSLANSKKLYGKNIDYVTCSKYRKLMVSDIRLVNFAHIEKHIPFSSHIDNNLIINKNGDFVAMWEVSGISFETVGDDELDVRKNELDNFIRSFSNENIAIYVNVIKKDKDVDIAGDFDGFWFAEENNNRYLEYIRSQQNKEVIIYVSLVMKGADLQDKTDGFITGIFSKITGKHAVNVKEKLDLIDKNISNMKDLCFRFDKGLAEFGARQLGLYEKDECIYSELVEAYNFILSGFDRKIAIEPTRLSNLLATTNYIFGEQTVVSTINDKSKYMKCVEIKTYSNETSQGIFDFLLTLPIDICITQSFSILSAKKGVDLIKRKKNQFSSSKDDGVKQVKSLDDFIDDLASGNISIGEYHFTVFIRADNFDDVQNQSKEVVQALNNKGFIAQDSTISLKPNFFAQLPSNFKYRTRVVEITSRNFAGTTGLHNFLSGKKRGNCWGNALTVFQTRSGQPYYFNVHEENAFTDDLGKDLAGNFMIIGGTGAGKTVLASWILEQSLKFNHPSSFKKNILEDTKKFRFIYFDKDRAVQMHLLALGGKYITLRKGLNTNLNPFALENTDVNINFLVSFVKLLCSLDGGTISVLQEREIYRAVTQVMSRERSKRSFGISLLLQTLDIEKAEDKREVSIHERLQKWSRNGALGWVFDNEIDDLDIEKYNTFGIDGTEFLDDKEILDPLMFYILHKIKLLLNGQRIGVFIDEIQKYAECPTADNMIDDLFRVIRKLQGFIGGATQDLTSIEKTKTYKVLLTQTETKIVMPEKVYREDYFVKRLQFTQKEFVMLQSLRKSDREFLVKKTSVDTGKPESVICRLNLACLGENLRILSIGSSERAVADKLINETDDARVWIKELGNLLQDKNN